jgi:hypothetical protein
VVRVAQSVLRLATGWTVRGSNPGGGEIFRTYPDRPWGPPSLLYNGYRVFPGGSKRPGRDADPSPPSSAEIWKQSSAIPLLSLRAFVICEKCETYLHLKTYSILLDRLLIPLQDRPSTVISVMYSGYTSSRFRQSEYEYIIPNRGKENTWKITSKLQKCGVPRLNKVWSPAKGTTTT